MAHATLSEGETTQARDDAERFFEIVNGERRDVPPPMAYDALIAADLMGAVRAPMTSCDLGRVVYKMLFVLRREPPCQRRPAVAFVSHERWPANRRVPRTAAWDVVPDLAVEVISPTNLADEIPERVREYFEAGVRLVWVVFSAASLVYVYESPTAIRVLTRSEELDGGAVLPGFRLPLASLFQDEEPPDGAAASAPPKSDEPEPTTCRTFHRPRPSRGSYR